MAWYRTGGGGVPASIKTDMNAVLNKKFSTETVYPPETWADNVNLLGKLPEATKSGSVVRFDDGANKVQIKNLIATIPESEEGVTGIEAVITGKNLAIFSQDILDNDRSQNGITFHAINENTVHISGTATGSAFLTIGYIIGDSRYRFLKKGRYILHCSLPDNVNDTVAGVEGYYVNSTTRQTFVTNVHYGDARSFTLTNDAFINIQITIHAGFTLDGDYWVQIEEGTTATDYAPFIEPNKKAVSLEREVFGGTADIITGEGVDENGDDYTFTPISLESLLGVNTIWTNVGDTSVTYRRDIELALAGNGNAPLMMMAPRPTTIPETEAQPEEDPEEIE